MGCTVDAVRRRFLTRRGAHARSAQAAQTHAQVHGLRADLALAKRTTAALEKAALAAAKEAAKREAELVAELAAVKISFEAPGPAHVACTYVAQ